MMRVQPKPYMSPDACDRGTILARAYGYEPPPAMVDREDEGDDVDAPADDDAET